MPGCGRVKFQPAGRPSWLVAAAVAPTQSEDADSDAPANRRGYLHDDCAEEEAVPPRLRDRVRLCSCLRFFHS